MKAKLALFGVFLVALYLVNLGSAENADELSFNLKDSKPIPQFEETVCGCPLDAEKLAKCNIQGKTIVAEKKEDSLGDVLETVKSLMNKLSDEGEKPKSMSLLSAIQEKSKKLSSFQEEKVISCDDGLRLKVVKASMSNANPSICQSQTYSVPSSSPKCNNTEETFAAISKRCNGKASCSLSTDLDELKSICECASSKYLNVTYSCVINRNRNKRQSESYLKGRQRAFSRLLMIGLYPTYFNFDADPPAVPISNPNPIVENAPDVNIFDGAGFLGPLDSFSSYYSYYPYDYLYGSYGSYGSYYDYLSGPYSY